jgi:hypothetical protein
MATVEQTRPEAPTSLSGTTKDTAHPKPSRPPRRRREEEPPRTWAWAALILIIAFGGAGAYYYRSLRPDPVADRPPNVAAVAPPSGPIEEAKPSPMPPPGEEPAEANPEPETSSPPPRLAAGAGKQPSGRPPGPAQVEITSRPAGARIHIDNGARTCESPCPLVLEAGRHSITALLDGYRRSFRTIDVPEVTAVHFNLEPMAGTLVVRSTPPGASILLDGRAQPQKTPAVLNVPAGRHKLEVRMEGMPPYEEEIEVKDQVISHIGVDW